MVQILIFSHCWAAPPECLVCAVNTYWESENGDLEFR